MQLIRRAFLSWCSIFLFLHISNYEVSYIVSLVLVFIVLFNLFTFCASNGVAHGDPSCTLLDCVLHGIFPFQLEPDSLSRHCQASLLNAFSPTLMGGATGSVFLLSSWTCSSSKLRLSEQAHLSRPITSARPHLPYRRLPPIFSYWWDEMPFMIVVSILFSSSLRLGVRVSGGLYRTPLFPVIYLV